MPNFKTCPKCHYQRTTEDDQYAPKGECPKCGIIYEKFRSLKNKSSYHNLNEDGQANQIDSQVSAFKKWKKIVYGASVIIGALLLLLIIKPAKNKTFPSNIPGTYIGELTKDSGRSFSVEFDVDEQCRVSRLLCIQNIDSCREEKILWKYPDILQIDYSDSGGCRSSDTYTSSYRKNGKKIKIIIDAPQTGVHINSTFDADNSGNDLSETGMLKPASTVNVFYTQFNVKISKSQDFQISREDAKYPTRIGYQEFRRYCNNAASKIDNILSRARQNKMNLTMYHWDSALDKCSIPFGYDVRCKVKFQILTEDLNSRLQDILDGKAQIAGQEFDTYDSNISFEIKEQNPLVRISINNKGYGLFKSSNYTAVSIPIRKTGLDSSDNESSISAIEWESVFINKNDPRIKYNLGGKERESAHSQALKKMKNRWHYETK